MMKRKDVDKKRNVMSNWRKLEERALKSSLYHGYKIMPQKIVHSHITGVRRADILAQNLHNSRDRKAGEVKNEKTAKKSHVNQAFDYKKYPFFAKEVAVHYPKNVVVPENVRKYAKEKNVKLIRTGMMKVKERQPGLSGYLKSKKYII